MRAASAAGRLLFREKDAAFGRAVARGLHGFSVGGTDFVVVMNRFAVAENRAWQRRGEHLRQEQIGDGLELISGGGAAGDFDSNLP